jgi:hypothetical protein
MSEGDTSEPRAELQAGILCDPLPIPERNHHVPGLKEDHLELRRTIATPPKGLIEATSHPEIGNAQRHDSQALAHDREFPALSSCVLSRCGE